MADDPVTKALASAKQALADANKFTASVTGGADNAFADKKPTPPHIPQAKSGHPASAGYGLASEARSAAEGLKVKRENVEEYERGSQ